MGDGMTEIEALKAELFSDEEKRDLGALLRRVNEARKFPTNTDGASRHVQIAAEVLAAGEKYAMFEDDAPAIAISMLATVAALYETRTALTAYQARIADLEATVASLRAALIASGRAAGGGLSDEVSNDFLTHVPDEVAAKVADLEAKLGEAREALGGLVSKLDECKPHIGDAFAFRQIHGFTYDGPTYVAELARARSILPTRGEGT